MQVNMDEVGNEECKGLGFGVSTCARGQHKYFIYDITHVTRATEDGWSKHLCVSLVYMNVDKLKRVARHCLPWYSYWPGIIWAWLDDFELSKLILLNTASRGVNACQNLSNALHSWDLPITENWEIHFAHGRLQTVSTGP